VKVKTLEPGLTYWVVAITSWDGEIITGYWRGDGFAPNRWEAIWYDTKQEAEGGLILAVAFNPEYIGRVLALSRISAARVVMGPDREHLRR
jgi:hypothetical protein